MKVTGDILNGTIFEPTYNELTALLRVFPDRIIFARNGWILRENALVPTAVIKGAQYFGYTALKTRSYDTEQQMLTDIRRAISNATGEFLDCSQGLVLGDEYSFSNDPNGFNANHIPQLFSLIPTSNNNDLMLTGYTGIYDFRTKLFRGQMTFREWGQIWSE